MTCFLILLVAAPVLAQNSDFSVLLSYTSSRVQVGPLLSTQQQINTLFNYAYQLRERGPHRLYVELPVAPVGDASTRVGSSVLVNTKNRFFFTPGVRYQYGVSPRVSLYTGTGFGVGTYRRNEFELTANRLRSTTARVASPAMDFAAGLDFRWTRLVSVRAEFRDFVRLRGPGRRNTPVFGAGLALHF